ncbi:porin [Maricaulis sp.]|uniref:porin n=1 Tax=Maricaulis sp. TaxID=1486257 RepID=UPI0025BDF5DD|nr:porin [Maricaulis sp.]
MYRNLLALGASVIALSSTGSIAFADDEARIEALEARIEQLEETNRRLLEFLESQGALDGAAAPHAAPHAVPHAAPHQAADAPVQVAHADHHMAHHGSAMSDSFVGLSTDYSYAVLDHAEGINLRQLIQLQAIQNGELDNRVTLSGAVTVLGNYQRSNSDTKFGWLMRHPTSANQIGEEVSELVVHSAQLAVTARMSENVTAYMEMLYNPEQSFGQGTITDLNRNQVQVRKAWVMYGNLDNSPIYAAIGKMDTPFGLNDTVSPFTNSTTWHSFAGLAYGGLVGYYNNGLHIRAMGIQGGAQFRAANAPVQGTAVPSRVNNFAIDANYAMPLGEDGSLMVGASYEHASPYCQPYPVFHFTACDDNNPAYAVYGRLRTGAFEFLGEFQETTDVWPGSAVPDPTNPLSVFEAQATRSWAVGGRYAMDIGADNPLDVSLEFSRFRAGADGAPWERQDQYVAGLGYFLAPGVSVFGEYIHTDGWVPLNFLSGGNFPDGSTWSENDASTDVLAFGVQAAF